MDGYSKSPVAVVTGGASGIGLATVEQLVARGYFVYVADIDDEKGALCQSRFGDAVKFVSLDVSSEEDFGRLGELITGEQGRTDAFINNAGVTGAMGPITELAVRDFEWLSDNLVKSVFLGTRCAARLMSPRGTGRIVNIASMAGAIAGHSPHLYAGAKAAVIHFSESVALELAEAGIQLNVVCPGYTRTPIITGTRDEDWIRRAEKISLELSEHQASGRIGDPEEVASAICWLACDAPGYIVGHSLVIDGGCSVGRPWRNQPEHFRTYHSTSN